MKQPYLVSGTRIEKVLVLEDVFRCIDKVQCVCECGKEFAIRASSLKNDGVRSCGCTRVHGLRWTRIYNIHRKMLERCNNPNHVAYHRYGGRGIKVSDDWLDVVNFHRDMGDPPEGYQIDRIDNDLGYFRGNCRWVTPKDNMNNRSNTKRKGF